MKLSKSLRIILGHLVFLTALGLVFQNCSEPLPESAGEEKQKSKTDVDSDAPELGFIFDQNLFVGSTLQVVASTQGEITSYVWKKDGFPIPDQTSNILRIEDVQIDQHAGSYQLVVSNSHGEAESNSFTVVVREPAPAGEPPVITQQPTAAISLTPGSSATLTVSVTGTAPFSFQWYKDSGSGFAEIAGASSDSLVVTTAGSYYVNIQNALDVVDSTPSVVSVITPINLFQYDYAVFFPSLSNGYFMIRPSIKSLSSSYIKNKDTIGKVMQQDGGAETVAVYECRKPQSSTFYDGEGNPFTVNYNDYFVSRDQNCNGYFRISNVDPFYLWDKNNSAGTRTKLYKCYNTKLKQSFVSTKENCEDSKNQPQGTLGYLAN